MLNLTVNRTNILLSVILGALFGWALTKFLPLAASNTFFLLISPLICLFFLLMLMNTRYMLVVLLFVRALLDPLLNYTKLNILGENIGIGGAINLFIIILAIALIFRHPQGIWQNNHYKSWIIFLFICGIAVGYSPVPGRAVRLLLNLVSYLAMVIVPFFIIDNVDDKKFWLKILFFSSLLPVGFANLDLLRGGSFFIDAGARIQGTFTHPNILAFYLVLIMVLTFYIYKSELFALSLLKRHMLRIYILNLLILLLATKTRSAWIACWGMFLIYGILKERRYILVSVLLPFLLLLHPAVLERIRDLFSGTSALAAEGLNSFAWRLELWKGSLPRIKEKIILGHGLASFEYLSAKFLPNEFEGVAAHNTYIELLFETGLCGLLSYLAIYLTALRRFSAKYAHIFSYIISYMIVCFADNMLYYLAFNWYFWFFVGIMLRSIQVEDDREDIGNHPVL